jgi:hypothetical protein
MYYLFVEGAAGAALVGGGGVEGVVELSFEHPASAKPATTNSSTTIRDFMTAT